MREKKPFSDPINNLASLLSSFQATYSYIYTRVTAGGNESGRKFKPLETFLTLSEIEVGGQ